MKSPDELNVEYYKKLRKQHSHHEGEKGFWSSYLRWLDRAIMGDVPHINVFNSQSPEPGRITYPWEKPLREDRILHAIQDVERAIRRHTEAVIEAMKHSSPVAPIEHRESARIGTIHRVSGTPLILENTHDRTGPTPGDAPR